MNIYIHIKIMMSNNNKIKKMFLQQTERVDGCPGKVVLANSPSARDGAIGEGRGCGGEASHSEWSQSPELRKL